MGKRFDIISISQLNQTNEIYLVIQNLICQALALEPTTFRLPIQKNASFNGYILVPQRFKLKRQTEEWTSIVCLKVYSLLFGCGWDRFAREWFFVTEMAPASWFPDSPYQLGGDICLLFRIPVPAPRLGMIGEGGRGKGSPTLTAGPCMALRSIAGRGRELGHVYKKPSSRQDPFGSNVAGSI